MTFAEVMKRFEKLVVDNSPSILTAVGVVGTLTTAYFASDATYKYMQLLGEEGYFDPAYKIELTPKEHVERAWRLYIPAATTASLTVTSIILANKIGTRRAAALAAAYSITEKAYTEYKAKVVERIGTTKEQAVRDDIAKDRIERNPIGSNEVIILGNGPVTCYESFTGRYFNSDMETLRRAMNDINFQINNDYYASLDDFYDLIGLPSTAQSSEVGWNCDNKLDLKFSSVLLENRPVLAIDFDVAPIRDYHRLS